MCGYFCIGFIDFMLKGKSLTDFTNLFFNQIISKRMMISFQTILKTGINEIINNDLKFQV